MTSKAKLPLPAALMVLLMLGACASLARILYPLQTDPLKSTPGIYVLDPAHANIIFVVNHLGFSLHHGRFNAIEGSLDLDVKAPEKSRVFIAVQAASIDTNNSELDEMLRAKSMFNVAEFSTVTFESTSLQITGDTTATIGGWLTIKGSRNNINLDATFIGSGTNPLTGFETVGFSGKATFLRSEYGLNQWLPLVGDEVTLIIEAEFSRAKR